ncbi:hypothetical protein Tco_1061570 [Tanacetum coccineum]
MFKHTDRDDSILGPMRFVSKSDDFQVYGELLPKRMTNQQIRDSVAYKTYLAYATGAASPKMTRKLKKPASSSKKRTLVKVEEEEPEPAKKDKPATKVARTKGIRLLYDATLLKEVQLKNALRRSKSETTIHQAGGSSEGVNSESEVPDEQKGKSIDTSEGTSLKPGVLDVSKGDSSKTEYELWGDSKDEDADDQQGDDERTRSDDEPTKTDNTKTSDDEEEMQDDEINEELYGDVNVSLTDVEPADKEKVNEEITVTAPRTSPLLTILVFVIPEHIVTNPPEIVTTASSTTPSSLLSSIFPYLQQLTRIPIPMTTEATTSTNVVSDSETLSAFHQRITDLENDVKELKTIDHSAAFLSTIKFEVPNAIKEYLGTTKIVERLRQQYVPEKSTEDIRKIKMEHARQQQVPKETITSSYTSALEQFDQKTTLFQTMTNSKSFNKSPKQRALYHALMESILEDEDAMDEGVADK